jgi:hypothetical protein
MSATRLNNNCKNRMINSRKYFLAFGLKTTFDEVPELLLG